MRIVAWNIRAGGGTARRWHRAPARPLGAGRRRAVRVPGDLAERRPWPSPSPWRGCRISSPHPIRGGPRVNALLLASRWPLRRIRLRAGPSERGPLARWPRSTPRWRSSSGPCTSPTASAGASTRSSTPCWRAPAAGASARRSSSATPTRAAEDSTSRCPSSALREEGWIDALDGCGWRDGFRHLRASARAYTWYSPNGRNGFRIDQAFVNAPLLAHLDGAAYRWGGARRNGRRDVLSDHAALLVDLLDHSQEAPASSARLRTVR